MGKHVDLVAIAVLMMAFGLGMKTHRLITNKVALPVRVVPMRPIKPMKPLEPLRLKLGQAIALNYGALRYE